MGRPVISAMSHVALRVRDIDASLAIDTNLFGLSVTGEVGGRVSLSHGAQHHSLQYVRAEEDSLEHVGLIAADEEAITEIRARVKRAGWESVSERPLSGSVEQGFAFVGPEGLVFEVHRGMEQVEVAPPGTGVRPRRFGHVNLLVEDPEGLRAMLEEVLDFRVSDFAGPGLFMRCNSDHHGIGIFPGAAGLHHYAWEVQNLDRLAQLADLVNADGQSVLWGPSRHGIGHNLATYVLAPSGVIVEYYADMDSVYDEDSYVPGSWSLEGHKWFNLWSPHVPEGFGDHGVRVGARVLGEGSAENGRRSS